jgi:4-aminobutyrate aminotransferase/(S)-3-amino-2-methylpropionate transaminase
MMAFDIVAQRGSREPDAAATKRVVQQAYQNGLILLSCGVDFNTIRVLVPLTCSDAVLDEGLGILERCLQDAQ